MVYVGMTYTLARKIELLRLNLRENFQELLHKANQLGSKVVLILSRIRDSVSRFHSTECPVE